jgi:molybdenum cofactor cytidylyltransferase
MGQPMTVGAILLAAGESSRMGQLKALLPWGDRTLLEYQIDQVAASCCQMLVVVLGHEAERLRELVGEHPGLDLGIVENRDYQSGKTSSIRVGATALPPDLSAIIVLTVDQPRPAWMLDRLIAERERLTAPVAVPTFGGRRGHPPIFAGELRSELLAVEVDDPIVGLNLNTPAEYAAARSLADRPDAAR